MTTSSETRESVVAQAVQEISHIATLPEVTLKIIDLVEDPSSTAQDLHKVIANDPALCSRILKVVNSAFYGLPGQIGSINRAIVLLGLNAVKNIAIATSLGKLFRGGELCPQFNARDLWLNSMSVAASSKMVAEAAGIGLSDEAFLAGLLHDIGIMVEMQANRQGLIEVFDDVAQSGGSFIEAENRILGADHQAFGQALCERWRFPKSFSYVTGYHHNPLGLASGTRTLACVVHVGDVLAAQLEMGFIADVSNTTPDASVLDELRLSAGQISEMSDRLPDAVEEVATILG
ncbi:MAG: HDOD domain-containing protein [Planctomycetota bacterium]